MSTLPLDFALCV